MALLSSENHEILRREFWGQCWVELHGKYQPEEIKRRADVALEYFDATFPYEAPAWTGPK